MYILTEIIKVTMKIVNCLLIATISLTSIFCIGCKRPVKTKDLPVRNVILTEVISNSPSITNSYTGIVEEGKNVTASFMTGGKLLTLHVKEGDRVNKGQLLATLDDSDYLIGVNQLQVQFDQMTAEKKRMDEMFARHNIAPNDYEKFEAGYEQLKLQMEMAKNKLAYTRLYSPSAGFISYRYMQPGELVDAGTPIYKIVDDSSLEVTVDLPLQIYLKKGDITGAFGHTPNIQESIPLNIISFIPDADNNQLYHIKLDIPGRYKSELTPGINMKVDIEMKNVENGTSFVPSRSLFYENGEAYVWIFNDNDSTISKKNISVKDSPNDNMSLVTGLEDKTRIVSTGIKQLTEGEKVNVIESPVK